MGGDKSLIAGVPRNFHATMWQAWAAGGAVAGLLILHAHAESRLGESAPGASSRFHTITGVASGVVTVPVNEGTAKGWQKGAVEFTGLPWLAWQAAALPAGAVAVADLPWLTEQGSAVADAALASQPASTEDSLENRQIATVDPADMSHLRGRGIATGGMAAAAAPASASVAAEDSLKTQQVAAIDNDELSHLRGRGIVGGNIVFFGLAMVTEVSGPQNFNATAGVNLQVNPSNPATSTIQTWTTMSSASSFDTQGNRVGNIGQPPSSGIGGVGQTIQVAGNDNGARNDVLLNVNAPTPLTTGSGNTCNVCTISVPNPGSLTPLSVKISVPNQGNSGTAVSAVQSIGLQRNAVNAVSQGIQIQTARSIVHNLLNLNVQIGPGSAINSDMLNHLLHKP